MDLSLGRQELHQVAGITGRDVLKLLPPNRRGLQRAVVTDDTGSISAFDVKKGVPTTVFKTNPGPGKATSLAIGGPVAKRDRAFVACGTHVRAVNKKGKEFFAFSTDLAEPIAAMHVEETRLWTTGEQMLTIYDDAKEVGSYRAPDTIGGLLVAEVARQTAKDALLGCHDRMLRAMQFDNEVMAAPVVGQVSALAEYEARPSASPGDPHVSMFGCEDGQFGIALADPNSLRQGWTKLNSGAHRGGAVTTMARADMTQDGVGLVVVGRDDGQVQFFSAEDEDDPVLVFGHRTGESIRALAPGKVMNADDCEVLFATYAGRIASLTTAALEEQDADDRYGRSRGAVQKEQQIKSIQSEIDELKAKLAQEKDLLRQDAVRSGASAASLGMLSGEGIARASAGAAAAAGGAADSALEGDVAGEAGLLALSHHYPVSTSLALDEEDAAYKFTVEIEAPIDYVIIQSDMPLDLLDDSLPPNPGLAADAGGVGSAAAAAGGDGARAAAEGAVDDVAAGAIVSHSPPADGNAVLATYRCQEQTNRLVVRLRTVEGRSGKLTATVVPQAPTAALRSASVASVDVKLLSLHQRVPGRPDDRPMAQLVVRGGFKIGQIHDWLSQCLPGMTRRVQDDQVELVFRNVLLGSQLALSYQRGEAVLRSDGHSCLAILREKITDSATLAKVQVTTTVEDDPAVLNQFLALLHPRVSYVTNLVRRAQLADAVREVSQGEGDLSWMTTDMADILQHGDRYKKEAAFQPRLQDAVFGIVTDLFVDYHKFQGRDVQQRVPDLIRLLDSYSLPALRTFIETGGDLAAAQEAAAAAGAEEQTALLQAAAGDEAAAGGGAAADGAAGDGLSLF